jgi:hypothetical protein
MGMDTFEV